MNTMIEIHDNDTNETGSYKVFYTSQSGHKRAAILSEDQVNSLLNMRQKELFLIGKFRFKVDSEYDFKKMFGIQ